MLITKRAVYYKYNKEKGCEINDGVIHFYVKEIQTAIFRILQNPIKFQGHDGPNSHNTDSCVELKVLQDIFLQCCSEDKCNSLDFFASVCKNKMNTNLATKKIFILNQQSIINPFNFAFSC